LKYLQSSPEPFSQKAYASIQTTEEKRHSPSPSRFFQWFREIFDKIPPGRIFPCETAQAIASLAKHLDMLPLHV
jgi:hypothetical protein